MNFWKYVLNVNNNMDDFSDDKLNEETKEDIQNSSQNNASDESQSNNSNDQLNKSDQRKSNQNENIKDSQDNSNEKDITNANEQVNNNDQNSSQNNEADESQNNNSNDQLSKSNQRKSNQNEKIKDSQDNSNEKDVANTNEQVNDNDQNSSQKNEADESQNKNSNDQLSKSAQSESDKNERLGDSQESKDNSNEKNDETKLNQQTKEDIQSSSQNNASGESQNKNSDDQLSKSTRCESDKNERLGDSQESKDNSNEKNDETKLNEQTKEDIQNSSQNNSLNEKKDNDNFNQKDSKKEFKYKRKQNVNKTKSNSKSVDNFTYYQQSDNKTRTYLDLQELRDKLKKLEEIAKSKKMQRYKANVNKEKVEIKEDLKPLISDETNNFLKSLGELPSFENRDNGDGYSIDTESNTIVSNTIIKTLINKFLNQRFCKKISDLNIRTNSLEKSNGFYKWEVKDVIKHLKTHEVTKVLTDKYGYEYAEGKNENVPLSFYFDMSGSMSEFTNMLATIAIELLRKNVKVLIGFNETVNVQIESIDTLISVKELADVLESGGYYNNDNYFIKNEHVKYKFIHKYLDSYLINKKCEKCVVFSDFDPISNVINLSNYAKVYWFCFENSFTRYDLEKFNGFIYKVKTLKDLEKGLIKVNQKRFETLVFTDNPENIRKKVIR